MNEDLGSGPIDLRQTDAVAWFELSHRWGDDEQSFLAEGRADGPPAARFSKTYDKPHAEDRRKRFRDCTFLIFA